jgi:alcohol dehydrogenase (cytochrome c)
MQNLIKIASTAMAVCLVVSGCQTNPSAAPKASATDTLTPTKTAVEGGFATFGYDLQQTRHTIYNQITKDNIKDVGLVWSTDFQKIDNSIPGGIQNYPIIVDGVLYATTSFDQVFAFDAVTGKQLWHWKPDAIGAFKNFGLNVNRGVAYGEGKVYLLTLDNKLVSLDAKTGKLVKQVQISDAVPGANVENGYYETTAPIYYKGTVYIGSSGGDNGVRGFVMAYKAADLTAAWDGPFWTVPPKGQDWLQGNKYQGGGAVWMPVAIDPDTDIMYFAIGNPSPDFYGEDRPGSNPNTDSVVAVASKTGKLIWAKQEINHDLWDYDAAASPMVLQATVNGKERKVVVEGGKSGQWWAWDAATGEVIYNAVPFTKIDHKKPTPEGVLEYPGVLGGENYAPESYDPGTNYVLVPAIEQPMIVKAAKNTAEVGQNNKTPGAVNFGTTMAAAPNIKASGSITAIDMNTGKVAYQKKTNEPMRGGFTDSGNGIAYYGDGDGTLNAMDIKTGDNIWKFQTGAPLAAAPSIFNQGGKDYLAIAVGGGSSSGGGHVSKLMVFAIGGDKTEQPAPINSGSDTGSHSTASNDASAAKEGTWLALNKAAKTVDLLLIGAYNGAQSGMNFNGYANGDMKITIPNGWKVNVQMSNANPQIPHSAMIVPESTKGTSSNFKEAFKGATTPDPTAGFTGSKSESFSFTADKAGNYLIWCAIPGHGIAGMYDTLIIDNNAKAPSITTPDKGTQTAK